MDEALGLLFMFWLIVIYFMDDKHRITKNKRNFNV